MQSYSKPTSIFPKPSETAQKGGENGAFGVLVVAAVRVARNAATVWSSRRFRVAGSWGWITLPKTNGWRDPK